MEKSREHAALQIYITCVSFDSNKVVKAFSRPPALPIKATFFLTSRKAATGMGQALQANAVHKPIG